jgi:5-(carboxyamino)imidazole ribonucleotide mutase
LLAAAVLALSDEEIADRLDTWREEQSASVAEYPVDK